MKGGKIKVIIPKEVLSELYIKRKLPLSAIAKRYNCSKNTVDFKLRKYKIRIRSLSEANKLVNRGKVKLIRNIQKIPQKSLLKELYINKKLSTWKIEKLYGYSRGTVHRKLKEYGIKLRTRSEANTKYKKENFNGNLLEKSYLIGFRLGDLRVRKIWNKSEVIHVDCGSTKKEQIELIKNLFKNYGRVWVSKPNIKGKTQIECHLNLSFDFLISKNIPFNLIKNKENFYAFLAGFTDAEGNIGINRNQAVYQIGNYNKKILLYIKERLSDLKINSVGFYRDSRKGKLNSEGYKYNQDYWHLVIVKKSDLLRLLKILKPYIKHKQKIRDLNSAISNILERNRKFGE